MPLYAASDLGLHCLPLSHKKDSRLYGLKNRAGPRSTVGNMSDCRYVSDCRSRGRKFDPGPVPYFHGY